MGKKKRFGLRLPDLADLPQWLGLLVCSTALAFLFRLAALPAAALLGPMLSGIAFGVAGARIRVAPAAFQLAQSTVGCLIASSITGAIVASVVRDGAAMLLIVATTVLSSGFIGFLLGRTRALPGPVAAWGVAPGGAAAMVAMAHASGADARLVATMQYVRVVCVVIAASLISHLILMHAGTPGGSSATAPAHAEAGIASVALAIVLAGATAWAASRVRMPAGALLLPMTIGAAIQSSGLAHLSVPEPLLVVAYAAVGWTVGLRFTRDTLRVAGRAMPQIVLASLAMIGLGILSAWLLTLLRHTDALTAFLATTPGGIDSVAIIALGSGVDVPFVMALQALRVFVVILTGAPLARAIARWATPR